MCAAGQRPCGRASPMRSLPTAREVWSMDYNDYGYGGLVALWLILLPILFVLFIAAYVIGAFFLMKVFEKAGVQGKWRAWVPVYNSLVAAKLGDLSPWVMLGAIVASGLLG